MRTVYLGTSDFAVTVLGHLARSEHKPQLVVTRPDRPQGRGRKLKAPPVAEAARLLGLRVEQPENVNGPEGLESIAAARPDTVCICAFGALIREPLLSAYPMLNVHPSLLPRWRGAAPIERAIEAGDEKTGVSIMRPVAEMDAGPICLQRESELRSDDDYGSLSRRLAELGGELLVEALDTRPECRPQPGGGITIAAKLGPEDRRLDPELPARVLERRVRALTPHVGVYVELPGGERLGVRRARISDGGAASGELTARDGSLLYGSSDGALELLEVQPAGGRPMDAAAYLRGHAAMLGGGV
ncbi:MAG TPA: methionyl-tRNA formyltransferase [Thermoleophilaceae bacterium]|nr:methionyl-tRNA formyltransferase [Thermoleophilaceae bacterium]